MPQRFLKPGITTSDAWNAVSWRTQSFYIRLITLVDDYGRYDGRSSVLWGQCFAVWNELNPMLSVGLNEVGEMLQELAGRGLIEVYIVSGKPTLQLTGWTERIRANVREKWQIIGDPVNPGEVAASCCTILRSSSPSPSYSPSSSPPSPLCPAQPDGAKVGAGEKTTPKKDPEAMTNARVALHWLNEKTGRHYRETDSNLAFISSRLREPGVEIEGVKRMIERQCALWNNTPQAEFLRPETLFNRTKFDGYYAAKDLPINANNSRINAPNSRPTTGADQRRAGIPDRPSVDVGKLLLEKQNREATAKRMAAAPAQP
jgi:uncharacterized phage protein (TIGR02220 family)